MRKLIFTLSTCVLSISANAQQLSEINFVRLWEHHSSGVNGGQTFGTSANGDSSGYDFVNHSYYNSFDTTTFDEWTGGQIANIDMVEHNGPYGNGGNFGFTSGVSTIWSGDIKGNGLTKYMLAPISFNYDTTTMVGTIRNAYVATSASVAVQSVSVGQVYLAKIRDTNQYVALKITNVKNGPFSDSADYYFEFKYKYGTFVPTSIAAVNSEHAELKLFPNPAKERLSITLPKEFPGREINIVIYDIAGRVVLQQPFTSSPISHHLAPGHYYLKVESERSVIAKHFVVE